MNTKELLEACDRLLEPHPNPERNDRSLVASTLKRLIEGECGVVPEGWLTPERFDEIYTMAGISLRRHQHAIKGQTVTILDNPYYHVASATLKLLKMLAASEKE